MNDPARFGAHVRGTLANAAARDPALGEELASVRSASRKLRGAEELGKEFESIGGPDLALESIVLRNGRPVLPIRYGRVSVPVEETGVWSRRIELARPALERAIAVVGRVEVSGHAELTWLGTAWLVTRDVVVTTRSVAQEFALRSGDTLRFRHGASGAPMGVTIDFLQEFGAEAGDVVPVREILHIEPEPGPDIAFLRLEHSRQNARPEPLRLATSRPAVGTQVAVIGHPVRDGRSPDQDLLDRIFGDPQGMKHAAFGQIVDVTADFLLHDCSTSGGSAGSLVLDLATGDALALHFAGAFLSESYAIPADVVRRHLDRCLAGPSVPAESADAPRASSAALAADVLARLRARRASAAPATPASPSAAREYGPLHEAAAVLARFDPNTLRPFGGKSEPVAELVADSAPAGEKMWCLSADVRVGALRQLRERGLVEKALSANARDPADPLQKALDDYVLQKAKDVEQQTLTELAASHRACEWLRAAGFERLPPAPVFEQRIDWLTLLQPFEHLAGEFFRGRVAELDKLRTYAGVLPPGSTVGRAVRAIEEVLQFTKKPPLIVFGPGGVGKSTLLSRFILEHARALESDRFPFAYLDFDRADVSAHEPVTLLIEAVRQLGIEYPKARANCDRVRQSWLERIRSEQRESTEVGTVLTNSPGIDRLRSRVVSDFASLVASVGAADRPILFVLDTFEEVQYRSDEAVDAIWDLLEELREAVPRLRVVVAGRANLPGRESEELPVGVFDEDAAVGYLQAQGIADPEVARGLARQIGGSPLNLKMAAQVARQEQLEEGGGLKDLKTRSLLLFSRVDDAVVQRQLYKRILGHIHDPEVQALAHPGLVLRRITPELILEVLAAPCKLKITTLPEARRLFDELRREVSLVSVATDGALEHRQDLRRQMLRLLEKDDKRRVKDIRERAVAYYERQPAAPRQRAEEIYHRLLLGQETAAIDARWLKGVEPHLESVIPEVSGAQRAYLASRLGVEIDAETRRLADLEDWERIVERKARDLAARGDSQGVIDLLRQRKERTRSSPLVVLEASALARLERWNESLDVLDAGIDQVKNGADMEQLLELSLYAAEVMLASGRRHPFRSSGLHLLQFLKMALAPPDRLDALAHVLALLRDTGMLPGARSEAAGRLRDDLRRCFDELPDDELSSRPSLSYWVVFVLEKEDARRFARALRIAGLPRTSPSALRRLGVQLAMLDTRYSAERGAPPGALAERFGVPPADSVTAAWSQLLLSASDATVRESLCRLLDELGAEIGDPVSEALAGVMRTALGIERDAPSDAGSVAVAQGAVPVDVSTRERARIVDAFDEEFSHDELRAVVEARMGRSVDAISGDKDDKKRALQRLLRQAQDEGWLVELVARATEARPGSVTLARLAESLGMITLYSGPRPATRLSSQETAAVRERLGRIAAQVCQVELRGEARGIGFLVGPDLVLTAERALDRVLAGMMSPADVALRFDAKGDETGRVVTPGTVFGLERDWLVASGVGQVFKLPGHGYALVRVRNAPGAHPIGGTRAEPSAPLRRWIEIRHPDPPTDEKTELVFVTKEAKRQLLHVASGFVGRADRSGYLSLHVELGADVAGAPCFTPDLELLLGVHVGLPATALRIGAILRDLDEKGLGGMLGAVFA